MTWGQRAGAALALGAVLLTTAACAGSGDAPGPVVPSSTPAGGLEAYTDRGDGCAQVVSAIGYADQVLRPRGQERSQRFDDAVRSRLAAVGGTIALELDDFPAPDVGTLARAVQPLAEQSGALIDEDDPAAVRARLRTFERYRDQAAALVARCRRATPPSSPAAARPATP